MFTPQTAKFFKTFKETFVGLGSALLIALKFVSYFIAFIAVTVLLLLVIPITVGHLTGFFSLGVLTFIILGLVYCATWQGLSAIDKNYPEQMLIALFDGDCD